MKRVINKVFTFFVLISPILAVYDFLPGTDFAFAMLLLWSVLMCITNKQISTSKDEMQLLVAILFMTTLSTAYMSLFGVPWFDTTLVIHNLWGILLCFFPLIFVVKKIDIETFVRLTIIIGSFAAVIVVWQRIMLIATGSFYMDVFLPGLKMKRVVDEMSILRPSAFFSEPAHFCIFMLPIFYLSLISHKYLLSGLFFFSVLCTGSTTGFVLVAIILLYYLYSLNGRHRFLSMFVVLAAVALGYALILLYYPQILLENIEKIYDMQGGDDVSSTIRLIGPLKAVTLMDTSQVFFGITLNQLESMLKYNGMYIAEGMSNYANGMLFMFISYGLIGFLFLIRYIIKKWNKTIFPKGFLIVFLGIMCSDQILFNAHFLYLVTYVILANRIHSYCSLQQHSQQPVK